MVIWVWAMISLAINLHLFHFNIFAFLHSEPLDKGLGNLAKSRHNSPPCREGSEGQGGCNECTDTPKE
jgi:hypothetical protein